MSAVNNLKVWAWIREWSSVVCTLFLLLLCLTGLPLLFHEEIEHLGWCSGLQRNHEQHEPSQNERGLD